MCQELGLGSEDGLENQNWKETVNVQAPLNQRARTR
jgi:hypothetical protein